jgi:hypothetical protein
MYTATPLLCSSPSLRNRSKPSNCNSARTNVLNQHNVNSSKVEAFKGLNYFYTNADSLPNKLYELKGRVQKATDGFDIIGITEVYPKKCRFLPGKAELQLEGFDLF